MQSELPQMRDRVVAIKKIQHEAIAELEALYQEKNIILTKYINELKEKKIIAIRSSLQ